MTDARYFIKKTRTINDTIVITIPKEICDILKIKEGEFLDVSVKKIKK